MPYTTTNAYNTLCDLVKAQGCVLKLIRDENRWGLHLVVLHEAGEEDVYRAAAVLFPSLEMLEEEAQHLLRWLTAASE